MKTVDRLEAVLQKYEKENNENIMRIDAVIRKYDKYKKSPTRYDIALSGVSAVINIHSNFSFTVYESD